MSYLHSAERLVNYKPLIMLKFLPKSGQNLLADKFIS